MDIYNKDDTRILDLEGIKRLLKVLKLGTAQDEILLFIDTQQKEIERLKCCGNCRDFNDSSDGYICDIGCLEDCNNANCCDHWQPLPDVVRGEGED